MRVLIVGDIHGRVEKLVEYLTKVKSLFRISAAIQLGDFGFYPEIFREMEENKLYFPVQLYAIDGNHENHDWLFTMKKNREVDKWKEKFNLYYLSRASVVEIGGTKIGAIGGALNVDGPQKSSAKTQSANYILKSERESAISLFNERKPELIVSHTCPTGIGIGIKANKIFDQSIIEHIVNAGFDPGVQDDCGDRELTKLWDGLSYSPLAWVFGHFHFDYEKTIGHTRFVCNNILNESSIEQIVVWDTEERNLFTLKF